MNQSMGGRIRCRITQSGSNGEHFLPGETMGVYNFENCSGADKPISSGDIIPELVAEEFEGPLYGSRGSMLYFGYIARNQLNRPHTLLATLTKSDADERLSRYEAVVILTVMLSRLEGDECLNHNVIPVSGIFGSASSHCSSKNS